MLHSDCLQKIILLDKYENFSYRIKYVPKSTLEFTKKYTKKWMFHITGFQTFCPVSRQLRKGSCPMCHISGLVPTIDTGRSLMLKVASVFDMRFFQLTVKSIGVK